MSIELQHTKIDSWSAVVMRNDAMRFVVIPEIGGKIISLRSLCSDREWLWRNPYLPLRKPPLDVTNFGAFDAGGWDEVFPTVNSCQIPDSAWGNRTLTDHGELWFRSWQILSARVESQMASLTLAVDEPDLPFRFERTLTLASGLGPLSASYAVANRSTLPMRFIWAAHPLFAIEPGDSFHLPEGTRISSTGNIGLGPAANVTDFEWPKLTLASGESLNLTHTPEPTAQFAIKLFAEGVAHGAIEIVDRDKREVLRLSSNSSHVPHIGLWLNFGAWSGANTPPYYNAGVEPTNFPQDDLSATIGMRSPQVPPESTIRWQIAVSINQCFERLMPAF